MGTRVDMGRHSTRDGTSSGSSSCDSARGKPAGLMQHQPYRPWDGPLPPSSSVSSPVRSPISNAAPNEADSGAWDNTAAALHHLEALQASAVSSPRSFRSSTSISSDCLTAAPVPVLRHAALEGAVSFHPYPSEPFQLPTAQLRRVDMIRVFIGQLPYGVTDMQLGWLCSQFGNGAEVYFPERIYQSVGSHTSSSSRLQLKGCVHVYCAPQHAAGLIAGLHERILVDDPGVWVATDSDQVARLRGHCDWLKAHAAQRPSRMPYAAVTAQYAKVQPSEPRVCRAHPTGAMASHDAVAASPPPLPSYLRRQE